MFKSLERFYTYFIGSCIVEGDDQDKFCYEEFGNIIYDIHSLVKKGSINTFKGVCFESMDCSIKDYMPNNLEVENFKGLTNRDVVSAMVFQGSDNEGWNRIEICKTNSSININYRFRMHEEHDWNLVEFNLPLLNDGKIMSEEIDTIVGFFTENFSNDFVDLVSNELLNFDKKIKIRNGNMKEVFGELAPKILINMTLYDIVKLLDINTSHYFKLMEDEFEQITGLSKKDIKVRKLI